MPNVAKMRAAVHAVIVRDGKVLALRRSWTGSFDGCWAFPAGKLDEGELPSRWAVRELFEEAGVVVSERDASQRLVLFYLVPEGHGEIRARMHYFARFDRFDGEPYNAEPEKASEMGWFPVDALPEPFVPHFKKAMDAMLAWETYLEVVEDGSGLVLSGKPRIPAGE